MSTKIFEQYSQQFKDYKEKPFGRVITEEELIKRCDALWPYKNPLGFTDPEVENRIMTGAVELHAHGSPAAWQSEGRANFYDTAVSVSEAKYSAIVFKDQDCPSYSMAGAVQQAINDRAKILASQEIEFTPAKIFGSLVLDKASGGMNTQAVSKALMYDGFCKEIFLPCQDSALQCALFGDEDKGIFVSDLRGTLTPEMIKILDMMAEHNDNCKGDTVALATCHVSNEEKYDISKYVHDRGMNVPIVHDHVTQEMTQLLTEEALQLIDLGTYVEICANSTVPWTSMQNWIVAYDYNMNMTKELLKARGPEHIILITDSGLSGYYETEGMRMLIRGLLKNGVSESDVHHMAAIAPAKAIGLL